MPTSGATDRACDSGESGKGNEAGKPSRTVGFRQSCQVEQFRDKEVAREYVVKRLTRAQKDALVVSAGRGQ